MNNKLRIALIVAVALVAIFLIGKSMKILDITGIECGLGSWDIKSYDSLTKELKLSVETGNIASDDCLGTSKIYNTGFNESFISEAGCLEVGFTGFEENVSGNITWACKLRDPRWYEKFIHTDFVTCTHSICGGEFGECSVDYDIGFNGFRMEFKDTRRSPEDIVSCSGFVIVKPYQKIKIYRLENNECKEYSVYPAEKKLSDYDALAGCQKDVEVKKPYFRLEDNKCVRVEVFAEFRTENDYEILKECEEHIKFPYTPLIFGIGVVIVAIAIIYVARRRK